MAYYCRIGVLSLTRSARASFLFDLPGLSLPFSSNSQGCQVKKLFVGNLPYAANETDVQNFFAENGVTIDSVTVMRDRFTGQARGFGFVEINDDAAATHAVEACHGKDLMGRTLVVNEARPMTPREGGGGGRPPRRG